MKMRISVRLSNEDSELFKRYAAMHGISVSELVRRSVMEKIEDEYDLKVYERVLKEYEKNPVTYTMDEVGRELGLP